MSAPDPEESTGVPGVRRWRTVYVLVAVTTLGWIALLTWLTEAYA